MMQGALFSSLLADITALARERDIVGHAYRVMRLAQTIASTLGLSQERVERLGLAALLHDLGKIALPKAILYKPGPLTEEEWDMVHRHPGLGRQMLVSAGGDWISLAPIVGAHHEHWDGHGYPRGLSKDAIPLEARILAIADSYDAMISPRVYQSPLTVEEAMAELQRCAGHQFDPQVVAAFLHLLDAQGIPSAEECLA
jgi:HD-GYP domain-containing protein (c-di-GMP phosphodiesterase class II)